MKKRSLLVASLLVAAALVIAGSVPLTASAAEPTTEAPSYVLVEARTGTVLAEKNAREHRPIASMVKIMTLLLTFESMDAGELSENEMLTVSENASSMGGSQAFLDAHADYRAGELIKSVVVASANDSCVALAERMNGSVDAFVERMNERAAALGMEDTNFVNCTGLPAPNQYSCARDAAVMFGELIKHKGFFDYSREWMFDLVHPSGRVTTLTNTNRMIRSYEGCDGGKTGFTNEAMYCLSATAERGGTRLIGVITGAETSKSRNAEMAKLFDHGFAGWATEQVIFGGVPFGSPLEVPGSKEGSVTVAPVENAYVLSRRGEKEETELVTEIWSDISLPLSAGSKVGKIKAVRGGKTVAETYLVTTSDLHEKSYLDIVGDLINGM